MSDKVGYKRPPKHSQFKKGQSGNPRGCPKGSGTLLSDFTAELAQEIQITENGRSRKITKQRALVMAVSAAAIKGDMRAVALVLTWLPRLIDASPEALADSELSPADRDILESYIKRRSEAHSGKKEEDQ